MGGTYMTETATGRTGEEAYAALLAHFRDENITDADVPEEQSDYIESWPDLFCKGWRQVWPKPVKDYAVEWMRGWIAQHPPQGTDPDDKWGPWMVFPLETPGTWHFFGWVNT